MPTPINFRERTARELDGFSEFAVNVTPDQQDKIEELAVEIIKSNNTADPIFAVRVEGFADIVRNPNIRDERERRLTEKEVSTQRAENGLNLLVQALEKKGGKAIAQRIAKGSKAFGMGTQGLRVPNATTEDQMKKNRRVVFIVRQVTFLPPPPEPPPPPSSVIENRFSVKLVRAANLTVGALHALESFTLVATLEITDSVQKKKAEFVVTATGGGFGGGPTKVGGSLTFTPGPPVPFKTFRLLGPTAQNIDLGSFVGAVTVFVDGGGGVGPATQGGTLSFSFDALESAGANTQPRVIRLPGGNSVAAPGIAAGDVLPLGRMTMKGTPTNL
jgi:hypothetical protein